MNKASIEHKNITKKEKIKMNKQTNTIPLFFAVDDNYAPYLAVTLESIIDNSSKDYFYDVNVLVSYISEEHKQMLEEYKSDNMSISFTDVTEQLMALGDKLHLRDYFTKTTYYRFFIAQLFPQFDKGLYLDSDIIVLGDIAELYNTELGNNYVGAIKEEVMCKFEVFGTYINEVLGIDTEHYFNAGVLVMNLKKFRDEKVEEHFAHLLTQYNFEVTQDQDYLNVICKDQAVMIPLVWNKTPIEDENIKPEDVKLIHYKINWKPWKYADVLYAEHFWRYAEKTKLFSKIVAFKDGYTDERRKNDVAMYEKLVVTAKRYIADENNFRKLQERNMIVPFCFK